MWISTDDGLFRLLAKDKFPATLHPPETTIFESFDSSHRHTISLGIPVLRDSLQDSQGNIWIATEGGGINVWNREADVFKSYFEKDGLIHNTVSAIVEDDLGFIWLGTAGGISRFDPKQQKFLNLSTEHGLLSKTFGHPAGLKTSLGEVVFGGLSGLTIIDPQHIFTNTYQAPLVMTGFNLFNEPVLVQRTNTNEKSAARTTSTDTQTEKYTLQQSISLTREITLRHDQSVLTFEFALLNYDVATQNQYAYKLEGFDTDWIYSGKRNSASYTNLDPGKYVFQVKAANNENVWSDKQLNVRLTILPPWWATWWANALYWVAAIVSLAGIICGQHAKRRRTEKLNKLLEEKIAERTQELELKNDELKVAYSKMEEASYSDHLTGLKNRRFLYNAISLDVAKVDRRFHCKEPAESIASGENNLIFYLVDIDFFKAVNDQYGHANGDIVLKALADALEKVCRQSDMVLRWGGEEFLVVCRYAQRSFAIEMAERLRRAVALLEIPLENNQVVRRTCSIGYACYPFDIHNPKAASMEQTIDIADWCLYKVKHGGRNGWAGVELNAPLNTNFNKFMPALDEHIKNNLVQMFSNKTLLGG